MVELDRVRIRGDALLRVEQNRSPQPDEQDAAIGAYIRWRSQHAQLKRDFAVNSKIRRPDYLPKVA
ncbi:hypothetical protein [Nocardia sp. NRRL WC-3656]|uniref:hypothetical protein n=1 Tax=Nocardia sp. NRRL WC-3656 TaxID=1463824 RepID=UPI000A4A7119|nr:hypothetical protein [Nocardia sp. NRRL WC-3656]